MKRKTFFLRMAVFLIGIPVLVLGILGLPWLAKNPINPDYSHLLYPIFMVIYVSMIPYFISLYQAYTLLSYIDKNQAFSELSVKALKNIKFCAMTISGLYGIVLLFVCLIAELDDAPGLIVIGIIPIFASMVIAVFAAVLEKLLTNAIDFKSENELTI